ncbi:hypothetical protein JCM21714_4789 [Gracilibacillus boraciitolerans JCM 21714]|uniref:Uncharacterized protein n=1 Tax=Gracilibacillus boraciitolerans JCM 21714 TaxID=1298598 RepID=W4VQL0_9BACI|nr:hypothetical protein JCM21714_4789 [Gracilibacillus boraciitolerans JCM 21714]
MNARSFPETYRADIKEAVEKTMRCGSMDLGYARYECLGCDGDVSQDLFVLHVKVDSATDVEKNTQMTGQKNNRK